MTKAEFSPLVEVVERLLAPGGCPWDRAQTHASMRKHMIEEAYEVCDAIDRKDAENLREELGDVLYQVVFHAALAEEEGAFDLQAVIDGVAEKMRRRHPHIFAPDTNDAPQDWESVKRAEKAATHQPQTLPTVLPVTLKLAKLTAKLRKRGVSEEEMLALCADATERTLLAAAFQAAAEERELEFSGQALAEKLEKMLENIQKWS